MPLDPLGSLSDPTCHGLTLPAEACAKLTCREETFRAAFQAKTPDAEMQKPAPMTGGLSGLKQKAVKRTIEPDRRSACSSRR